MSPEQLNHQKYSLKSDVFSFGVLLFEIFKQSPPWPTMSPVQAAALVMSGKVFSCFVGIVDFEIMKISLSLSLLDFGTRW